MKLAEILKDELPQGRFWTHGKQLVTGCTKISPGCLNCWSEAMNMRFVGKDAGRFDGKVFEHVERMADILPKSNRRKQRVWTYWNDMFHEGVSDDFQIALFENIMQSADYHIICTKRPHVAFNFLSNWPTGSLKNVIIMVTMEDQQRLSERWMSVVKLAAKGWKVGLLIEPMLTAMDLDGDWIDFVSWIVCGPENGPGKRPFDPQWAISLRDQAALVKIPFFYKANAGFIGERGQQSIGVPAI